MINSLWDTALRWAEKSFLKARIYKRVFNFKSNDAVDVLADLQNFCGANAFDVKKDKNSNIDPLDMARRAGRLEVYQYIFSLISATEEQKNVLATRFYNMQTQKSQETFK